MINPIIHAYRATFPGLPVTRITEMQADRADVEDRQKIADILPTHARTIRQRMKAVVGPVITDADVAQTLPLHYYVSDLRGVSDDWLFSEMDVMRAIELVQEGALLSVNDTDFLRLLYMKMLGRKPDAEGFAFWADVRAQGMAWDELVPSFLSGVHKSDAVRRR